MFKQNLLWEAKTIINGTAELVAPNPQNVVISNGRNC